MRRVVKISALLAALAAASLALDSARAEDDLRPDLARFDKMRKGPDTPFGEVESLGKELLSQYTKPEHQGEIYYELTSIYVNAGKKTREQVERMADYARKGVALTEKPADRLQLYLWWGSGLRGSGPRSASGRTQLTPEVRKAAAEVLLQGLKEAQKYNLPDKPPDDRNPPVVGPLVPRANRPPGPDSGMEMGGGPNYEASAAARREREAQVKMCWTRDGFYWQLAWLYRVRPHATAELRELATKILDDKTLVDKVVKAAVDAGAPSD